MHSGTNLHLVQELPQSYYVNVNNREDCSVRYGSLITSYIYIYIYICSHDNNVPSQLSPQWLCGNSCTWAHDVRFTLMMFTLKLTLMYMIYAHLASVRFEHSVCRGSLMTSYIYIYIYEYICICMYIYIIYIYI